MYAIYAIKISPYFSIWLNLPHIREQNCNFQPKILTFIALVVV